MLEMVFTGVVADGDKSDSGKDYSVEDGGHARIQTFHGAPSDDRGVFVRLQSWCDQGTHEDWKKFAGKMIRITVEVVEGPRFEEENIE